MLIAKRELLFLCVSDVYCLHVSIGEDGCLFLFSDLCSLGSNH